MSGNEERIRQVFQEEYWDLGVFRWMNRNKRQLKASFLAAFILCIWWAFIWSSWPIAIWAFAFIGIIWAGGIDHFIIGLRFKKMINVLKAEGIEVNLIGIQDACEDIMPN